MSDTDRQADSAATSAVTEPAADPAAADPVDPAAAPAADEDTDQAAADARRDRRPKITEQRLRLNATAVAILRQRCPSATLGGSIELAAERLDRLEAEAASRELLQDYLAAHAQAQAVASAEQADLLASISQTLHAGLSAQQQAAAELDSLAQQILEVVKKLAEPPAQTEDRIALILGALAGVARGIEAMSGAVNDLAEQIAGLGN